MQGETLASLNCPLQEAVFCPCLDNKEPSQCMVFSSKKERLKMERPQQKSTQIPLDGKFINFIDTFFWRSSSLQRAHDPGKVQVWMFFRRQGLGKGRLPAIARLASGIQPALATSASLEQRDLHLAGAAQTSDAGWRWIRKMKFHPFSSKIHMQKGSIETTNLIKVLQAK